MKFVSLDKLQETVNKLKEYIEDSTEIFMAQYGVTTNAEIVEALTAGKTVLCNYANVYIGYLTVRNTATQHVFMSFVGGGLLAVFICNNNSWMMGQLHVPTVAKSTEGHLAQLDANGNLVDSGITADDKVDKVTGKGLSTNDYTTAEKNKLASLPDVILDVTVEGNIAIFYSGADVTNNILIVG